MGRGLTTHIAQFGLGHFKVELLERPKIRIQSKTTKPRKGQIRWVRFLLRRTVASGSSKANKLGSFYLKKPSNQEMIFPKHLRPAKRRARSFRTGFFALNLSMENFLEMVLLDSCNVLGHWGTERFGPGYAL